MATFTISTAAGFSMEQLNLFDLFEHAAETKSATLYKSLDDAANLTNFTGVGLTYAGAFPDTQLTGGTITGIQDIQGGATIFRILGASIPAVNLYNYYVAADTVGALSEILSGNDTLTGGAGNDVLVDLLGDNRFVGGLGADIMRGGLGSDTYVVDNIEDVVDDADAFSGVNTVESSISYIMPQSVSVLILTGAAAINGRGRGAEFGPLNDTIVGNNAANILDGGTGNDTLSGGLGNDTYIVDTLGDTVIDTGGSADEIQSYVSWFLSSNPAIEKLTLIGNAIRGDGNDLNNTITGNAFNNVLNGGGAGNDLLIGGAGNDFLADGNGDNELSQGTNTFKGETGDDRYRVETATDLVVELAGEGYDTVDSAISYTLTANVERLNLDGFIAPLNATGNLLDNTLIGNFGDNTLNGLLGADIMRGGQGNDTYVVDNLGDRAIENTNALVAGVAGGVDQVNSSVSFRLGAFVENLTLTGAGANSGIGNNLANVITGNGAANIIDGKQGADTMIGGAGNDTYFRDDFGDTITDTTGIDTVNSSVTYALGVNLENLNLIGSNTIGGFGNNQSNLINGNGVANALEGNDGNDTLDGRGGSDTMIGGLGGDKFQFTQLSSAFDSILDFNRFEFDKIQVSAAAFGGGLVVGALAFNQLVVGAAPVANLGAGIGQFLYDNSGVNEGKLFWDANGTTAGGAVHIATLNSGVATPLLSIDFIVIA
jgi:Ca2+-binding RTX toxin-like protein